MDNLPLENGGQIALIYDVLCAGKNADEIIFDSLFLDALRRNIPKIQRILFPGFKSFEAWWKWAACSDLFMWDILSGRLERFLLEGSFKIAGEHLVAFSKEMAALPIQFCQDIL